MQFNIACLNIADEITGNNFTCICSEGMEGPLCDTPYCLKQHCENGYCNTTRDVPICQCQLGFEGKYCEINIDDCVSPTGLSPCKNGGVCIDGIGRYDCNCSGTGNYACFVYYSIIPCLYCRIHRPFMRKRHRRMCYHTRSMWKRFVP